MEELEIYLPSSDFKDILSESLDFKGNKEITLGFYPIPKNRPRPAPSRISIRHNKEKPIPFAKAPQKIHRTSQNQGFHFYLQTLKNSENINPLQVDEMFVIIREVQPPSFEGEQKFMHSLDKIFLLLEAKEFNLCQMALNSLILETETKQKNESKLMAEMVSYLSYLKGLLFDLDGDYQKGLYFYNEGLNKLRKFPETGTSSNIFYAMGCLFFNERKLELACKCFLKTKSLRDQYISKDIINVGVSSHHSAFLLNNIACCLVHFSKFFLNFSKLRNLFLYFFVYIQENN